MSFLMTIGIGIVAGVTSPIWGGAIKDKLKRHKNIKEGVIPRNRPLLEDFYDRAETFIEAFSLEQDGVRRGYGEVYKISFESARTLIEDRNEVIRTTIYKNNYEFDCPICGRKNYRLSDIKSVQYGCRCPSHNKIRKFVSAVENSR